MIRYGRSVGLALLVCVALLVSLADPGVAAAQDRLGTVDFPTSGAPEAQPHFLRGVLLLHSFEYGPAAAAFREAQRLDPEFAMAFWGEALSHTHPVWNQQDREAGRAVLDRLAGSPEARQARASTERERAWLAALEVLYGDGPKARRDTLYSEAMGRLARDYPDDTEARAFYALSLLGLNQGDRDVSAYMRAAAVAMEIFDANPDHPGAAHYIIHSFDDPVHAPLGLKAARAYSRIAPDAAHAQHMTSHIFVALGMWDDVVAANEVAFEVSGRRSGHYTSWLQYGYLQQGRYDDAQRVLDLIVRHTGERPTPNHRSYLAAMRARQLLETESWDAPSAGIEVDTEDLPWPAAQVDFTDGVAGLEASLPFEFGPPRVHRPPRELLGELLLAGGRPVEALRQFELALARTPGRAMTTLGLARAAAAAEIGKAVDAYATLQRMWRHADPAAPLVTEADEYLRRHSPQAAGGGDP